MAERTFLNAKLILPDRVVPGGLVVCDGRIAALGDVTPVGEVLDLGGNYLSPGFVDPHVHGGGGADFMDLTADAFRTVCRTHAKHGTTTLTPTSTTGDATDYREFLRLCRELWGADTGGARIGGGHLYGPYFWPPARGCHPDTGFETPDPNAVAALADGFGDGFPLTVTIAPELPGAIEMTRAAALAGVRVNIGHSYATYEEVEAAVAAGARHVDHLFCAMSDRAKLRIAQPFPMRAGVMEATLSLPQLTTEVIADGTHLADSLLLFAHRMLPNRLCLVTDSSRAVDMPDGEYWFGPEGRGVKILKRGDSGLTLDGTALGSGVVGMDHCVRTMLRATAAPLHEVIRMASLTPATVIGLQDEIGSLAVGKRADVLVLDEGLNVVETRIAGEI